MRLLHVACLPASSFSRMVRLLLLLLLLLLVICLLLIFPHLQLLLDGIGFHGLLHLARLLLLRLRQYRHGCQREF